MNTVSSKEVIGRLLVSYNIQHRGWLNTAPMWINDAVSEIGITSIWELNYKNVPLEDGIAQIPCDTQLIEAIYYKGKKLRINHFAFNNVFLSDTNNYSSEYRASFESGFIVTNIDDNPLTGYYINPNEAIIHKSPVNYNEFDKLETEDKEVIYNRLVSGFATISRDSGIGILTVVYRKIKTVFDQELSVDFPYIINNDNLKQALQFYVIGRIMLQGLTVLPFTFDRRLEDINPYLLFEKYKKMCRNELSFNKQLMLEIHGMSNTLLLSVKA